MNTIAKLQKYREYLEAFKVKRLKYSNDPLSNFYEERLPSHFQLDAPSEITLARKIRHEILGKTGCLF